ncbi:MAG TPA: SH3 domain-containing protein, partial [Thermomicrobiales bacterium]|nr:SH3 domain-containing protein [Thermomicrobiales bacterium]
MTLRVSNYALVRRVLISAGLVLSSVLAVFALIAPEIQAASTAMSSSYVNLRTGPAATTTIELIVPPGAAMTVSGDAQAGYFPVVYGERSGWVATELVQVEKPTATATAENFDKSQVLPDGTATLVESLNLRSGPGTDYDAIQVVDAGTKVEATGEISGGYEKVKFGGEAGWVRSIYVDRGPEPEGDEVRQEEILATVAEAGRPLVSAGTTMVTDAEIVLRQQPTHDSTKVAVVPVDSSVTLTGNEDKGYLEAHFDGKTGWVASGYMRQATIPAGSPPDVPVLMYHSIQEHGAEYQVTAAQLEEQLQWLSQNGYESITSADLIAWMTYGTPLPEKPVIISIDDGNSTDWLFLELLERYGFEGVFSLPNYAQLTASQIR